MYPRIPPHESLHRRHATFVAVRGDQDVFLLLAGASAAAGAGLDPGIPADAADRRVESRGEPLGQAGHLLAAGAFAERELPRSIRAGLADAGRGSVSRVEPVEESAAGRSAVGDDSRYDRVADAAVPYEGERDGGYEFRGGGFEARARTDLRFRTHEAGRDEGLKIARESLLEVRDVIQGVQVSAPFGNVKYALEVFKVLEGFKDIQEAGG